MSRHIVSIALLVRVQCFRKEVEGPCTRSIVLSVITGSYLTSKAFDYLSTRRGGSSLQILPWKLQFCDRRVIFLPQHGAVVDYFSSLNYKPEFAFSPKQKLLHCTCISYDASVVGNEIWNLEMQVNMANRVV